MPSLLSKSKTSVCHAIGQMASGQRGAHGDEPHQPAAGYYFRSNRRRFVLSILWPETRRIDTDVDRSTVNQINHSSIGVRTTQYGTNGTVGSEDRRIVRGRASLVDSFTLCAHRTRASPNAAEMDGMLPNHFLSPTPTPPSPRSLRRRTDGRNEGIVRTESKVGGTLVVAATRCGRWSGTQRQGEPMPDRRPGCMTAVKSWFRVTAKKRRERRSTWPLFSLFMSTIIWLDLIKSILYINFSLKRTSAIDIKKENWMIHPLPIVVLIEGI